MFLYFFVEKNGNHELRGAEVEQANLPKEIVELQTLLSKNGHNLSDAASYEAQLLNGAKAGQPGEEGKMPEVPATT